jgi:hypothetical protein
MFIRFMAIAGIFAAMPLCAAGQTSAPSGDAADVYLKAAQLVRDDDAKNIMSPASSDVDFQRDYPPLPDEWVQMEKQDYDLHAQVRELVHEADSIDQAHWPVGLRRGPDKWTYLDQCRNLANEIADAAEYQGLVLNDQPAAFTTAGDLLHLPELLRDQPKETAIRLLVADGIDALAQSRLMVLVANAKITNDATNAHDLPLATATQWISRLLDHPSAEAEVAQMIKSEGEKNHSLAKSLQDRILEVVRRAQAERDLTAMSLAAHVYQFKHGRWPESLQELATELPSVPTDSWGDGKQTLGYALIPGGMPDGSDRPLVYSRDLLRDGLFFRTDEPQYSFYTFDGSNLPPQQQKRGGQFRDVANWVPQPSRAQFATTQPLE